MNVAAGNCPRCRKEVRKPLSYHLKLFLDNTGEPLFVARKRIIANFLKKAEKSLNIEPAADKYSSSDSSSYIEEEVVTLPSPKTPNNDFKLILESSSDNLFLESESTTTDTSPPSSPTLVRRGSYKKKAKINIKEKERILAKKRDNQIPQTGGQFESGKKETKEGPKPGSLSEEVQPLSVRNEEITKDEKGVKEIPKPGSSLSEKTKPLSVREEEPKKEEKQSKLGSLSEELQRLNVRKEGDEKQTKKTPRPKVTKKFKRTSGKYKSQEFVEDSSSSDEKDTDINPQKVKTSKPSRKLLSCSEEEMPAKKFKPSSSPLTIFPKRRASVHVSNSNNTETKPKSLKQRRATIHDEGNKTSPQPTEIKTQPYQNALLNSPQLRIHIERSPLKGSSNGDLTPSNQTTPKRKVGSKQIKRPSSARQKLEGLLSSGKRQAALQAKLNLSKSRSKSPLKTKKTPTPHKVKPEGSPKKSKEQPTTSGSVTSPKKVLSKQIKKEKWTLKIKKSPRKLLVEKIKRSKKQVKPKFSPKKNLKKR